MIIDKKEKNKILEAINNYEKISQIEIEKEPKDKEIDLVYNLCKQTKERIIKNNELKEENCEMILEAIDLAIEETSDIIKKDLLKRILKKFSYNYEKEFNNIEQTKLTEEFRNYLYSNYDKKDIIDTF